MKMRILKVLLRVFGSSILLLFRLLSKSQFSPSSTIRAIGYCPLRILGKVLGMHTARGIRYLKERAGPNAATKGITDVRLLSFIVQGMLADPDFCQTCDLKQYRAFLASAQLDEAQQFAIGHQLFAAGSLSMARETFADLLDRSGPKIAAKQRLQLLRDCGITHFMDGLNAEANYYWSQAASLKRLINGPVRGSTYRIVGPAWFAAIGHVAMLDYYIKYNILFRGEGHRTVIQPPPSNLPGSYLLERFIANGLVLLGEAPDAVSRDYNKWAKPRGKRTWSNLSEAEQFALVDDFWEFEFPDECLGYTHAAARIQQEWERRSMKPLLSVTLEEREFIDAALRELGVPQGAWYVCLHVREPGFHKKWNSLYPSTRDANVEDYYPAINEIVSRGGWVIRMGDPTMKPLPKMAGVIDYAHSRLKTQTADVIIPLGCRFLLGTNSGYATIPEIFGIRCAFTNWVPIGLPLWSSQDLFIPKLFWNRNENRHLSLEEIFKGGLAYVQNWADIPAHIRLENNSVEDILELTLEMLAITDSDYSSENSSEEELNHSEYKNIAERHGSYVGSRIGSAFMRRHPWFLWGPRGLDNE